MNILLKSSILALLTTYSVVSASDICTRVGNDAAELIIIQNWCTPERPSRTVTRRSEPRCRELAIRQCRSTGTLQNAINRICPNITEAPSQSDLFNWGNMCERTVDGLIGRGQGEYYAQGSDGAFLAKAKPRIRRKPRARRHFGKKYGKMSDVAVLAAKAGKYIKSPTPPPTPDNSVAGGFRAGQMAMQKWWADNGSDCDNAWGLRNRAETFKDDMFPDRGNPTVRARNQGARLGVDAEVKSIQDKCFSYTM